MKMAVSARFTASVLFLLGLVLAQKEIGDIEDGCPPGSYSYGTHCYSLFTLGGSYDDAELACEGSGGILAVVKDPETHRFIQNLQIHKYHLNYWIGLQYSQAERVWSYFNGSQLKGFNRWAPGKPNHWQNRQDCAHMCMLKNLLWDGDTCFVSYLHICQFEARNCNAKATRFGPYCFKLSRKVGMYTDAFFDCLARRGFLAVVKTQAMHELLKTMIYAERWWKNMSEQNTIQMYWNGKHSISNSWIGIKYVQGAWVYSDGTFVTPNFTKWAPRKPKKANRQEHCVLSGQDWYGETCSHVHPFICQYDPFRATTKPPEAAVEKLVDDYTGIRFGKIEFAFLILGCFVLGAICSMLVFYRSHFLSNPRERMKHDGQDMAILENEVTNPAQDDH